MYHNSSKCCPATKSHADEVTPGPKWHLIRIALVSQLLFVASCGISPSATGSSAKSQSSDALPVELQDDASLNLRDRVYQVNYSSLVNGIKDTAKMAALAKAEAGVIYACGSALYSSLDSLPTIQRLYPQSSGGIPKQQRKSECTDLGKGRLSCTSEPQDWTDSGWGKFAHDLLITMDKSNIDIFKTDQAAIDEDKVVAALKADFDPNKLGPQVQTDEKISTGAKK